MRFWLLIEISLSGNVSLVGLYSRLFLTHSQEGFFQELTCKKHMPVAFAGSQLGQIWADFSKQWQEEHSFPYRHALAECQVSASKYRITRDLVISWLPENFNEDNSLLGDIFAEVVTVWQNHTQMKI